MSLSIQIGRFWESNIENNLYKYKRKHHKLDAENWFCHRKTNANRSSAEQFAYDFVRLFYKRFDWWRLSPVSSNMVGLNSKILPASSDISFLFFAPPSRLPFNWKTFPIGYSIAFCFEYVNFSFILQIAACVLCFLTGSYLMLTAIIDDIENELETLNENYKANQTDKTFSKQFHEIIQIHSDAKQLSFDFLFWFMIDKTYEFCCFFLSFSFAKELVGIYMFVYTIYFLWGLVTTCSSLLMVDQLVKINFIFDQLGEHFYIHFFKSSQRNPSTLKWAWISSSSDPIRLA